MSSVRPRLTARSRNSGAKTPGNGVISCISPEPIARLVKADPGSRSIRASVYAGPAPRVIPGATSDDLPKRGERLEGLNLGPHLPNPHSGNVRRKGQTLTKSIDREGT